MIPAFEDLYKENKEVYFNCKNNLKRLTGMYNHWVRNTVDIFYIPKRYMGDLAYIINPFLNRRVHHKAIVPTLTYCVKNETDFVPIEINNRWGNRKFYKNMHFLTLNFYILPNGAVF